MEIRKFLIESALLTHGLKSITNEVLLGEWKSDKKNIVWIDNGEIIFGSIKDFVSFRNRCNDLIRIDCFTLEKAIKEKLSGALTASGTMAVCQKYNIKLAITCGMGGIGDIKGEELCPDLPALEKIPVCLISTSPKDMLDVEATLTWLKDKGVRVLSAKGDACTGYIFNSVDIKLQEIKHLNEVNLDNGKLLILNPIPTEDRVKDLNILKIAIEEGKKAEAIGKYYHPAVNGKIDELTDGYSSYIQLKSIINNIEIAEKIIANK